MVVLKVSSSLKARGLGHDKLVAGLLFAIALVAPDVELRLVRRRLEYPHYLSSVVLHTKYNEGRLNYVNDSTTRGWPARTPDARGPRPASYPAHVRERMCTWGDHY
jgi:hypothetical protein